MEKRTYLTNFKALSFGECRRMGGGLFKGALTWVLTRAASPGNPALLPQLPSEHVVRREAIAPPVLAELDGPRARLEERGYRVMVYQKMADRPGVEAGGLIALSGDGRTVAFVNFIRSPGATPAAPPKAVLAIGLRANFEDRGYAEVSNFGAGLDEGPGCTLAFVDSTDPHALEKRLARLTARHTRRIVTHTGPEDVLRLVDREEYAVFRDRVDRRQLFIAR